MRVVDKYIILYTYLRKIMNIQAIDSSVVCKEVLGYINRTSLLGSIPYLNFLVWAAMIGHCKRLSNFFGDQIRCFTEWERALLARRRWGGNPELYQLKEKVVQIVKVNTDFISPRHLL